MSDTTGPTAAETIDLEKLGHSILDHTAAATDHPWARVGAGVPTPDEVCGDEIGTVEDIALDAAVAIGLYLDVIGIPVEGFFETVIDKLVAHGVDVGQFRDDYEG